MDAYSGYNQIMMHEDDKANTSFIIERGTYCYKVMPFGLKNAGSTYQRLVNKIFNEQIGKTMEVYVDDMLVKAPERADHIENLAEYNMKSNPNKCTFGVSFDRFIGYLVTQRGIEAHPNQIKAMLNMKSPTTTKEIQSLTSRAAALNRFLSRSTDKCMPFFKALKKGHKDKWDDECEVAFQNLKTYLSSPLLLSKLIPGEDLYIYLAVSDSAVSSALIREELGAQHPQLHVDVASNHKGAGAIVVIITPDGTLLEQAITLGFSASNNEAEYEAISCRTAPSERTIDQEIGHVLRLSADHESSLRRVHGKAPKNGPVPR
ncbi:unnamed protein product [Prunus armeniaca]